MPAKIQIVALAVLLSGCATKQSQDELVSGDDVDSVAAAGEILAAQEFEEDSSPAGITFDYDGVTRNAANTAMATIDPLTNVLTLATQSIRTQDSVEYLSEGEDLTPSDSALFKPAVDRAYKAILDYKEFVESGSLTVSTCPQLLQLTRVTGPADSTQSVLPAASASSFFADKNFFFLGGVPFVSQYSSPDGVPFADPLGKPERHYVSNVTENSSFLLRWIFHTRQPATTISYGPPISSYEGGPQEVNGVGSIIHNFTKRVPVFFLTAKGVVPADLLSIKVLLSYEYGCVSSLPAMEFASHELIDAWDILGVYIPSDSKSSISFSVVRGESLWTADLNGDGLADLACVSGTFSGASSDTLAEEMWFVNDNGEWKIIDWGSEPDCT